MRKKVILLAVLVGLAAVVWLGAAMFWMPGRSAEGPLPELTPAESSVADNLKRDVEAFASGIGERHAELYEELTAAGDYVDKALEQMGYSVHRDRYDLNGRAFDNIVVEQPGSGRGGEIVVVGAHYDTVPGSPGANDNGSGVASLLALAERFSTRRTDRTIRFVAFVNEEAPFAHTERMGSNVYAQRIRDAGDRVVAMISLETVGYYLDAPGSQRYPWVLRWLYPNTGNFIAFVGNLRSRRLLKESIRTFRTHATIPSEGGALLERWPGVGWSDHWSFWRAGYPAIMVTDTAFFRYPAYHSEEDTADQIDFDRLARVVVGLEPVVADLAGGVTGTVTRPVPPEFDLTPPPDETETPI